MTEEQALEETKELWLKLADETENGRSLDKDEIPGPWINYVYNCPCCEFARGDEAKLVSHRHCLRCPMREQWRQYYTDGDLDGDSECYICLGNRTPYKQWEYTARKKTLLYDIEFFCRLIVELVEEAISERKVKHDENLITV